VAVVCKIVREELLGKKGGATLANGPQMATVLESAARRGPEENRVLPGGNCKWGGMAGSILRARHCADLVAVCGVNLQA